MTETLNRNRLPGPDPWSIADETRLQRHPIVAGWHMLAIAFLATARSWVPADTSAAQRRQA